MSTEPKRGTCDAISANYHLRPHVQTLWCKNWREGESASAQPCIDCGQPESDKAHDPDCPSIIDRHKFEAVPPAAETATELSTEDIIGIAKGLDDAANGRTKPIEQIERELAETAMYQEVCDDCGHKFGVWFAANPLWNRVIPNRVGMLCPCCFIVRAEASGVKCTGWQLIPENHSAETAMTAEQLYDKWKYRHKNIMSAPTHWFRFVDFCMAHVREAAQGRYDRNLRDRDRAIERWRTLAETAERKLAARNDACEVCWTSSWAPCPEGTPDAVANPDSKSNPWMVCQLCSANEGLRKLAELEKALHWALGYIFETNHVFGKFELPEYVKAQAALASLRAESKEG